MEKIIEWASMNIALLGALLIAWNAEGLLLAGTLIGIGALAVFNIVKTLGAWEDYLIKKKNRKAAKKKAREEQEKTE